MHLITCLRGDKRLAKVWEPDGTITNYDSAYLYTVRSVPVADLNELGVLLASLQDDPRSCIIRGQARTAFSKPTRRTLDEFEDRPSPLFMVDVDDFTGTVEQFVATLPDCFHDVSYVWQLSGSHGHPSKPGLRAHLWFWLTQPLTCAEAEAWSKKWLPGADATVHRTVQVNYTARPVMAAGVADPIDKRLGLYEGMLGDDVIIPASMPVPDVSHEQRVKRAGRRALVDPAEKPGVIGAFCRAFTPYDLCEIAPHLFEAGSTPERITWLQGGGTPEGVRITDSGTHLYNSHSTAPVQRAVNLFDFLRLHEFGEHDKDIDPEVIEFEPTAAPSYVRMVAWANSFPEVQQELQGPKAEAAVEAAVVQKAEQTLSRVDMYLKHIDACKTQELLRGTIAAAIVTDRQLHDLDRFGVIATKFQEKLHQLSGTKPAMGDVKRALALKRSSAAQPENDAPAWMADWVWSRDGDVFVNVITKEEITRVSFDATYNREMAPYGDPKKGPPPASHYALANWDVPIVAATMYYPVGGLFFEYGGKQYLNRYRDADQPKLPGKLNAAQTVAIALVRKHIELVVPDPEERAHFMDWLAYVVQNPGRKIRHAVVIKGIEGDGKTVFNMLMGLLLGPGNVRTLNASTLETSTFTSWASGACVTFIEEVKLHGKNRHDVLNRVKPYITNDVVEEHAKHRDPRQVPNVTNYVLFTNYDDAMPLDDGDRRYFYVRSPYNTPEELRLAVGGDIRAYFDALMDGAVKAEPGALRQFFLEYAIRPGFSPDMRAPATRAKQRAINLTRNDEEDMLREVLEEDGRFIFPRQGLVSGTELQRVIKLRMQANGIESRLSGAWFSALLGRCGFVALNGGEKLRLQGELHRVYMRGACEGVALDADRNVIRDVFLRLEGFRPKKEEIFEDM